MVRLKDKVAVITGAGSGIGMETARTFHREGAYTVLADIEPEAAAAAAREIDQAGERSLAVTADVSKHEAVAGLMEAALAKWGRVDILVNNAGITRDAQLTQMTLDQFDHVIAVNLRGVYLCGQAAARIMLEQGQGVIINMSSIVGIHGNFGQSNYAAAKAGVIGMTKTWARNWAERNSGERCCSGFHSHCYDGEDAGKNPGGNAGEMSHEKTGKAPRHSQRLPVPSLRGSGVR